MLSFAVQPLEGLAALALGLAASCSYLSALARARTINHARAARRMMPSVTGANKSEVLRRVQGAAGRKSNLWFTDAQAARGTITFSARLSLLRPLVATCCLRSPDQGVGKIRQYGQ